MTLMLAKSLLMTVFGALLSAQAWAIDEGIDYVELGVPQPTETGDKVEVLEVFMYSCPHCFHLEPTLEKWLETKPENVEFRRMPAVFGPKVEPHASAFYAAELMGVTDEFSQALFDALHVKKQRIWDEDALIGLAESVGIDGAEFRKAFNSFFVKMKVNRAKAMGVRYGVDGVPAIIVNGKYRTSPSQTGSRDKMIRVVDYLIGIESDAATADKPAVAPSVATGVPDTKLP
jgi:thiol:disulfide interchange protein DsbA